MLHKLFIGLVIAIVASIGGINVASACEGPPTPPKIDIKPYSYPNVINCHGNGTITVAILTDDDGYAASVDVSTVLFEGASPWKWKFEDVDGDGDPNIVFHFRIRAMTLVSGQTIGTLTWMADGIPYAASDSIIVRGL